MSMNGIKGRQACRTIDGVEYVFKEVVPNDRIVPVYISANEFSGQKAGLTSRYNGYNTNQRSPSPFLLRVGTIEIEFSCIGCL